MTNPLSQEHMEGEMNDKTIGEMGDREARYSIWRVIREMVGDVPMDAVRLKNGGFRLSLNIPPDQLPRDLPCGDCGRVVLHNIHRPDMECEDVDAHLRDMPDELHHPFLVGAPVD
jgi:hypothetical protein